MQRNFIVFSFLSLLMSACTPSSDSSSRSTPAPLETPPYRKQIAVDKRPLSQIYQDVAGKLKTTMLDCPGLIWPEYDWRKFNVIMIIEDGSALVWKGETGQLEALAKSDVPKEAQQGIYSFLKWKGGDALSINPGTDHLYWRNVSQIFELTVHEGFHFLGQRGWESHSGQRGTVIPLNSSPRIYRRMMYDRLKEYFTSHGQNSESLGKASFWFQKWSREFPHEVQSTTDGYEGTARYVEYMAEAVAYLGCSASHESLTNEVVQIVKENMGQFVSGDGFQLDSEGYDLGGIAAFSLRFLQNDQSWFAKMKSGVTPLEILLSSKEAVMDQVPATIEDIFKKTTERKEIEINSWMAKDLEYLSSKDSIRIGFPITSRSGSYSPKGFFLPSKFPGLSGMPLALPLTFKGDIWEMTAKEGKVLFHWNDIDPCHSMFFAVVPKSMVIQAGNQLTIKTAGLEGTFSGQAQTDSKGDSWFCGR